MDKKQQVIDKLKGERQLKCPFCKNTRFIRKSTCFCDMWERGENGLCDEDISSEEYEYLCKSCGRDLTNEELE